MATLPAHSPTGLQSQVQQDVQDVLLSDFRAPAIYKSQGQGDGALVNVHLSTADDSTASPAKGRTDTHRRRMDQVMVPANPDGTDAGHGVTADGEIIALAMGDTLTVHGADVGVTAPEAVLRVGKEIRLIERAYWTAEVHL